MRNKVETELGIRNFSLPFLLVGQISVLNPSD